MIEATIIIFSLVLVRTATLIAVFPLFSGRNLPNTVKVGLAVALTLLWTTTSLSGPESMNINPQLSRSQVAWLIAVAREALLGGTLGVALGLFLLPIQIAGAYLASHTTSPT